MGKLPIVFSPATARRIVGLLLIDAVLRAADYLSGDYGVERSMAVNRDALPMPVWGVLLLAAVVAICLGVWRRWSSSVEWGALVLAATYAGQSVGLWMWVISEGWPPDGFRLPATMMVLATVWILVSRAVRLQRRMEAKAVAYGVA